MTISEEAIRDRAYQIWEREGHPLGRESEHWQQAIEELSREANAGGAPAIAGLDGPVKAKTTRRSTKAAPAKTATKTATKAAPAKTASAKPAAAKTTRARKTKSD